MTQSHLRASIQRLTTTHTLAVNPLGNLDPALIWYYKCTQTLKPQWQVVSDTCSNILFAVWTPNAPPVNTVAVAFTRSHFGAAVMELHLSLPQISYESSELSVYFKGNYRKIVFFKHPIKIDHYTLYSHILNLSKSNVIFSGSRLTLWTTPTV